MYLVIKRIFDLFLAIVGFVILLPLFVIVSILIKITSPGPVLFKQERVGKMNTRFTIYKFRTMRIDTPSNVPTHQLDNATSYITSIGSFLRKTSLDEIPQIINIIKGDMSVVGPRPSLPNQYDLNQYRIQNGSMKLKPGLTGYAQIKGRDELPIPIKADYDKYYVNHISFKLDVYIFFATFISVLRSDGVKEGQCDEESSSYR